MPPPKPHPETSEGTDGTESRGQIKQPNICYGMDNIMSDIVLVAVGVLECFGILERGESTRHDEKPSKNDPCE